MPADIKAAGVRSVFFCALAVSLAFVDRAEAACTTFAPASDATVTCDGANAAGVIGAASDRVTIDLLSGGSIVPAGGPSIWLGADADIELQGGTTVGNPAIANNFAILMGDSSIVTLSGLIESQGGITGPTQGGGSTGFTNALITMNQGAQIITSGVAAHGLDGRAGGNTYAINGEIRTTGISGQGIRPGNNDDITIGATGKVTTLAGDTSDAIDGFGVDDVTVTVAAGGAIELHGIGRGMQFGDNAHIEVSGTITSTGDAAATNSAGGVAIEVGANSYVWLKEGGQITTGNTGGLGNQGAGGIGISTWQFGTSGSTVIVDGTIDTQRATGIFSGTGDDITIGATGQITTRGTAHGIFGNNFTSPGNDTVTIDVAGSIDALGTGAAIFLQADNAGAGETQLTANVTVMEGGSLFAQSAAAYNQLDGCCGFPEVIDNLVVAGSVARGNAGDAIELDDGADMITLLPTYSITGGIDGGSNADAGAEVDTFALDGAANTAGSFSFDANAVSRFEAGLKKGLGTWTLAGTAGSGLDGTFDVEAGTLFVNGSMTSTAFAVDAGATLGGIGTIESFAASGNIAPGNSIGILNTATAAFNAGSIYEVEIDPTDADRIVAMGLVTIDPTAMVEVLPAAGQYADGTEYLILQAGTRSGTFGGIIDNSAFLDFLLDHNRDPNQVWLTISSVASFPDVAETPNQTATAAALQGLGAGNPLFDAILALDEDAAREAFDLASGEIHASAKGVLFDDSRFVREAVIEHLSEASDAGATGAGSPSSALGYAAAPQIGQAGIAAFEDASATHRTFGLWGRGYGSWGRFDGDGNAAGIERDVGGLIGGFDVMPAADWLFGAAAGYQASSMDVPDRASSAGIEGYTIAAYGGFEPGSAAFRFGGSYGWHDIDTRRSVVFPGVAQILRADYDANVAQIFGEASREIGFRNGRIEPFAGLAYVNVATDGFTEGGGSAALTVASSRQEVTYSTFGSRFEAVLPWGAGRATFRGMIAWKHAFGDVTPESLHAFAGGTPFSISGIPIARDTLRVDAGLDYAISDSASFDLVYSGEIAPGVSDHGLTATFTVRY